MIWSIAWRNVWRSKSRSIIMIVAIALGLFAGVFTMAFMGGAVATRIEAATKSELAHLQIHAPRFLENNNSEFYLEDSESLMHALEANDTVVAVSRRLIAEPFINSAHGAGGGKLLGIEPEREKQVTDIWEHLVDGTYLEKSGRIPPILIGQKLATKLKLKVRSKINVQMVDMSGHLSSKAYRISGIYKTSNTGFDEISMFVLYDDLRAQLAMPENTAHEIALLIENGDEAPIVKQSIENIAGENEVKTWKEISPEMALLTDSMDQYMYVFILIILLALCFGIINTMLMAVLERTKEIGMLMAVGMNKSRIFIMIVVESIMLTLTGGILGIILGSLVCSYFETRAIDVSMFSDGLEKYGFATQIYTMLKTDTLITLTVLVIVTGIISAIYPARKALKLNPAEATRSE